MRHEIVVSCLSSIRIFKSQLSGLGRIIGILGRVLLRFTRRWVRNGLGVGARVRVVVNLFDAVGRQMSVDLGGGEGLVAQQLLNAAEVRAVVQEVRGEAVAQRV